ncbi:hypothetical protein [Candidatus Oleimmundimicrobium sp.]|uniref:hypothetical protein n=1 Tax=Candidatus Oleimmundimicrobium sp. TaxID=3060597 RepID=UPI0027288800|nr:hypothetical protein [Candidatus Oleimmundimicrobium sp.]MDO8885767.1 hypothetical protein [Candidatus Oleimmundimicrobium sp.]
MGTVGKTHSIKLDGNYYMLLNKISARKKYPTRQLAERIAMQATRGEQDFSNAWRRVYDDWSLGFDQDYHDKEFSLPSRFKDSSAIDISERGEIKLLPPTSKIQATANTDYDALGVGLSYLWTAQGTNVYYYDGTTMSAAIASGATTSEIIDFACDGQYMYANISSTEGVHRGDTSIWAHWSDLTGLQKILYHNKTLYGITATKLYQVLAAAASVEIFDASTGWTLTGLTAEGTMFGGNIYFCGHNGNVTKVWVYDGTGTSEVTELPSSFIGLGCNFCQGLLWVYGYQSAPATGSKIGVSYFINSGTVGFGFEIGEETANRPYQIETMADSKDKVYFNYNHLTGLGCYNLALGGISKDVFITLISAEANQVRDIAVYKNKKYFTVKGQGVYKEGTTYNTTGYVIQSLDAYGIPNITKLYQRIGVTHKTLAAAETVKVEYSIDRGANWVEAGTSSTDGDKSKEWAIVSSNVKAKEIQIKTTLAGDGSTTPTVLSAFYSCEPLPEYTYDFELLVAAFDHPCLLDGRTKSPELGEVIIDNLWASIAKQEFLSFTDTDGTVYNIKPVFEQCGETTITDTRRPDIEETAFKLILREVK